MDVDKINKWIDLIGYEDGDNLSLGSIRTLGMIKKEVGEGRVSSASSKLLAMEVGNGDGGVKNAVGCKWEPESEECETYETSCGNLFQFFADGPKENGFTHCPYCGKELING